MSQPIPPFDDPEVHSPLKHILQCLQVICRSYISGSPKYVNIGRVCFATALISIVLTLLSLIIRNYGRNSR